MFLCSTHSFIWLVKPVSPSLLLYMAKAVSKNRALTEAHTIPFPFQCRYSQSVFSVDLSLVVSRHICLLRCSSKCTHPRNNDNGLWFLKQLKNSAQVEMLHIPVFRISHRGFPGIAAVVEKRIKV